ncbi:MAG: PH domain-containing protein [bacterium]
MQNTNINENRLFLGYDLVNLQKGEEIIFKVKRHPVGIFYAMLISIALLSSFVFFIFYELPKILNQETMHVSLITAAILLICFSGLIFAFNFFYSKIYFGNGWVLTSDSLTQISQQSLFRKQSSQLSLANLQDVTAEQNGLLTHIFGYGTVKCVTAGDAKNFDLSYCPDPSYYAKQILNAKEKFVQVHKSRLVQNSTDMAIVPNLDE